MTVKKYLVPILVATSLLAVVGMSCQPGAAPPAEPEQNVIKVGVVAPLSGPAAGWGLPEARGCEVWIDILNEEGGVEVAGKTYMLEGYYYDDKGWVPSDSLQGVQKGVLEDGVLIYEGTPTVAVVEAVAPFLEEHGGLWLAHGASAAFKPEWPHVMCGSTMWPLYYAPAFEYAHELYPEIERVAITGPDGPFAPSDQAWIKIGAESEGFEIVYNELFLPDTIDFSPLVSAILATDPDLICLDATSPANTPPILRLLMDGGYEGRFEQTNWHMPSILEQVPAEYVEGAVGTLPELDDPSAIHPMLYKIYQEFNNRWPGDWSLDATFGALNISIVLEAMKMAGTTTDLALVNEVMLATDPFPHPYFGEINWGGEEVWGANHYLLAPAILGQVKNGKFSVTKIVPFDAYYEKNLDVILKYAK